MSFPNIPNITPTISLSVAQSVPLLLNSIALEELALAHLINAEAEKVQFVLGTLTNGRTLTPPTVTISNLLDINTSARQTLQDVIKKEMLLEFKFENILELLQILPSISQIITPTPPPATCPCSAEGHFDMGDTTIVTPGFETGKGDLKLDASICPNCGPSGSSINFSFKETAGGSFTETFTSTSIDTSSILCAVTPLVSTLSVSGTGTGNYNGTPFTSNFTLALVDTEPPGPTESFTLTITTPNGPQVIVFSQNGEGHLDIAACPT